MRLSKIAISERALKYLIINLRKGNRNFPQRTPVWQRFALREEGEFAPLHIMCAPKKGAKSGENADSRKARGGVALKLTENRRRRPAEVFVNQKDLMRVPKSLFWISALKLPHTCGYCGKIECGDCIV